ncbi:MAG: hypothetical protein OMM_01637 [Candidatus Magnetoglobus multicellularis str. Araruama]|uniref:Alginate export domain-containing protein n=1 Tax=Candidatus Magnetoglobus multicellularis str. Araruama TaxID=890399 RepID=A0A1V1PCA8_9BACT|nr:MAG: hypothetical protein OMM_01637 [Candidatus Magnetoglobus multicellularis str. Araruama]
MKHTLTIISVMLFVLSMIMPAYAIEHQLGGDLRFRAFTEGNFDGNDKTAEDRAQADSRTHLKYTAKINEDFAVYTKFRIDSVWGKKDDPGVSGANAAEMKLMVSYIDFKIGEANFIIGKQDFYEARGNLLYDSAPGISIICPLSDQFTLNAKWIRFGEGDGGGNHVHHDFDTFALTPTLKLSDNLSIKPYFWYVTSNELKAAVRTWDLQFTEKTDGNNLDVQKISDLDLYYIGFDFDASLDPLSIWFTALYQTGSANLAESLANNTTYGSVDFSAIAALGGGSINFGKTTLAGQLFYASGDGDLNDNEYEQFIAPEAGYYYWSEIMGLGYNDYAAPQNMNYALKNIMGGGGTATICATDDITLTFGLWYAAAVEDFRGKNGIVEADDYGTEIDAIMNYSLMDNLTVTLIGAYVMAGDAITEENVEGADIDGANPYFVQAQIKASF